MAVFQYFLAVELKFFHNNSSRHSQLEKFLRSTLIARRRFSDSSLCFFFFCFPRRPAFLHHFASSSCLCAESNFHSLSEACWRTHVGFDFWWRHQFLSLHRVPFFFRSYFLSLLLRQQTFIHIRSYYTHYCNRFWHIDAWELLYDTPQHRSGHGWIAELVERGFLPHTYGTHKGDEWVSWN